MKVNTEDQRNDDDHSYHKMINEKAYEYGDKVINIDCNCVDDD